MQNLKARTKKFALDVIIYSRTLLRGGEFLIINYSFGHELTRLLKESDEPVAILTSSRKTANRR